ncbi:hypothetical protein [Stutzerimonas chloritidismutans]
MTEQAPAAPEAQAEAPAEAPGQPAPAVEYTDFAVPEGMEMDAEVLANFKGIAKELGIPQEAAQKLIDLQASLETKRSAAAEQAQAAQKQQWADQIKADPELGGANFDKTVETAVKAVEKYGTPELRTLLNETGLGNNPLMVKFCHAIGKALSEDGLVMGGTQSAREMSIVDAFK